MQKLDELFKNAVVPLETAIDRLVVTHAEEAVLTLSFFSFENSSFTLLQLASLLNIDFSISASTIALFSTFFSVP